MPLLTQKEIRSVWSFIDRGEPYSWRVKGQCKERLRALVGDKECARLFAVEEPITFNRQLRPLVAKHLMHRKSSRPAGRWIVASWGGIRRGVETVDDWADAMSNAGADGLDAFREERRHERISSWSKLLAFANCTAYAIYDARTAATLNAALEAAGCDHRFRVPQSRNEAVQRACKRDKWQGDRWVYEAYLDILQSIVRLKLAPDILLAEMTIFANSLVVLGCLKK